jgi:hypothetical protein
MKIASDRDSNSLRTPQPTQAVREPLVPSVQLNITDGATGATSTTLEKDLNEPLTVGVFQTALNNFRYDIHKEFQIIVKEQIRLFGIAKVCLIMQVILHHGHSASTLCNCYRMTMPSWFESFQSN